MTTATPRGLFTRPASLCAAVEAPLAKPLGTVRALPPTHVPRTWNGTLAPRFGAFRPPFRQVRSRGEDEVCGCGVRATGPASSSGSNQEQLPRFQVVQEL